MKVGKDKIGKQVMKKPSFKPGHSEAPMSLDEKIEMFMNSKKANTSGMNEFCIRGRLFGRDLPQPERV